jgi:hypothetical protein
VQSGVSNVGQATTPSISNTSVGRPFSPAEYPTPKMTMNVAFYGKKQDADHWIRSQSGQRVMFDIISGMGFKLS